MRALVVGGGIGGFSAALCLHQQGIGVEVFEQADGVRELGVGINLLSHAVKELSELGLLLGIAMRYRKVAGFERERLAGPRR